MNEQEKAFTAIIDYSALKDMIEGKDTGNELVKKIKEITDSKDSQERMRIFTTPTQLLGAIWQADPNCNITNLQKILSFIKLPEVVDWKSADNCRSQMIHLIETLGKSMQKND